MCSAVIRKEMIPHSPVRGVRKITPQHSTDLMLLQKKLMLFAKAVVH
jgi:hypothetical protein